VSVLDRFRRIERSRAEAPEEPVDPTGATAERIEGVERPGPAPRPATTSGADLERFAPAAPQSLELASTDADRRPFTRCMRCGMDHNASVTECAGCGASLDTPAQRDFNERLWRERQGERAEEERARAAREALRARDQAELASAQRALGEAIAREVGERERSRLDALDPSSPGDQLLRGVGAGLAAVARWVRERLSSPGPR
jgi:hypothetical protein